MDETLDQGQESTETIAEDTQQATPEQSETTEQEVSNLHKLPDGRELSGDELLGEYSKLNSEFTKRSQKLSEFEKTAAEREKRAEVQAQEALDSNELLKDVDPNVKEAIGQIALNTIKTYEQAREVERAREEKDREWNSRFDAAEKTHDGKDGLPKFAKDDVLAFMMDKEIYDPEVAYSVLHRDVINDNMIKDAIKGKGSTVKTESTGTSEPGKPAGKKAKNFEEAAKNAFNRIKRT
jgi:hypothetical protein